MIKHRCKRLCFNIVVINRTLVFHDLKNKQNYCFVYDFNLGLTRINLIITSIKSISVIFVTSSNFQIITDMKKKIIGFSGLLVVALLAFMVVNAQASDKKDKKSKKAKTEVTHDCSKCPSAATCTSAAASPSADVVAACDTTKCKKDGKCDPAKCKEGKCEKTGDCKKECKGASAEMKSDSTKCCKKAGTK